MEQRKINPWTWQDPFGFSQAIEVSDAKRVLYCAGQASVDAEGRPVHAGDMKGQMDRALTNLETVLKAAGFTLADVVRLNFFTTDVAKCLESWDTAIGRLAKAGCQPACTLVGVTSLAFPELMIEIEATASK